MSKCVDRTQFPKALAIAAYSTSALLIISLVLLWSPLEVRFDRRYFDPVTTGKLAFFSFRMHWSALIVSLWIIQLTAALLLAIQPASRRDGIVTGALGTAVFCGVYIWLNTYYRL